MNKNPFLPAPTFTPQQPPLPPGPPPPQPAQADYSGWWAGAGAHQPHAQPPPVAQYNPQWASPQAPRPPADQTALYANYGYGSQNSHWQRQQQQYHPPPPVIQQPPPPPTSQPGYNPYQPATGYPQPYAPQPGPPQPIVQAAYSHPPSQPQQIFAPPMPPHQPHHQPPHQPTQPRNHHASPQHLPPAKRQRFDGPSTSNRHHQNHQQPQPQFQPPSAPQNPSGFNGPNRGPIPSGPGNRNVGPTGPSGRGGSGSGRGRGGSMGGNRGGPGGGRGRGGSFIGVSGGRGGAGGGQTSGPLRGHGSRNFGGGKDFHSRRGGGPSGAFSGGGGLSGSGGGNYPHQGSSSFRGRNQGPAGSGRGNRSEAGSAGTFGSREVPSSSSFAGKKDENRRTLTDFKIIGLSISDLDWTWGAIHGPVLEEDRGRQPEDRIVISETVVKEEIAEDGKLASFSSAKESKTDVKNEIQSMSVEMTETKQAQEVSRSHDMNGNTSPPPPSRIRIYFHTPVTADDSRPIPHNSSYSDVPSDIRKGKRKKLEDDDGDLDERRAPPPPPQMGSINDNRSTGSVAPSVAETTSEADWLMAAIVDGEEEVEAAGELELAEEDMDELHISRIDTVHHELVGGVDDVHTEDGKDGIFHAGPDIPRTGEHSERDVMESSTVVGNVSQDHPEPGAPLSPTGNALHSSAKSDKGDSATHPTAAESVSEQPKASQGFDPIDSYPLDPVLQSGVHQSHFPADDTTDHPDHPETQVYSDSSQSYAPKSLQTLSAEPTLLNIESQESTQPGSAQILQADHLPEPPASPVSNTLLSASSTSTYEDASFSTITKVDNKVRKPPSANRLSISYARGIRRLVVDAEIVESFRLFRQEGRIEVVMKLNKNDNGLQGILMEGLSDVTKSYIPLATASEGSIENDPTVPPFSKVNIPSTLHLTVYLDTSRPLSEPKWAKTGDIQEWVRNMFGRMFWVAGDAAEGWEKKIQVVDPDPPPTIWTVLDGWATNSPVGVLNERQRFLKTHMTEADNILEILLRLVRGERATAFSQSTPTISAPSVSGPLLTALTQGSAHGSQQTHVSLAVLAIFRLSVDYAQKALGGQGKEDAEEHMGEIIRCLPSHLIYKSLDGIFKEWRVEKKGR